MIEELISLVERELPDPSVLGPEWEAAKANARSVGPDAAEALVAGIALSHCLLITPEIQARIDAAGDDLRRLAPLMEEHDGTLLVTLRSFKAGTTTTE